MSIKCGEIADFLEEFAPLQLAEEWDNVGLLVGQRNSSVSRVMVCLDVTLKVVEEAISKKVDMIVSHHPFIFKSIKSISGNDPKTEMLFKLIKNDINVYSSHTNLDVAEGGVNDCLARTLGLMDLKDLNDYKQDRMYKLVVFVPVECIDKVRQAVCKAGAGFIGNYSDCTFITEGTGTFRPLEGTNPYIGTKEKLEKVTEYRMETIVPERILKKVIKNMIHAHPYEEVAYDIYPIEIRGKQYGLGKVGILEKPEKLDVFIANVKRKLNSDTLRVIGRIDREVNKVAVFCGSFDENWSGVKREKVDILVTGEIKYHTALEALEMDICVLEAGHFETEVVVLPKLEQVLSRRFSELEIIRNSVETNPFKIS